MSILRPLTELWAYWGHWQNYEHMRILRPLTELWAHEDTEAIDRIMSTWAYWGLDRNKSSQEFSIVTVDDMAPHGARASTSTVRIKFTCIEETFQCLPEHTSILRPLTELWAHEHTEAIDRTMSTWAYWGHWQNYEHMSILRPRQK